MILPLRVLGRPGRKSISFGATAVPRRLRTNPSNSRRSASDASKPAFSDTKALTTSTPPVGFADDAGFRDRGMLHQRAFDFKRAD